MPGVAWPGSSKAGAKGFWILLSLLSSPESPPPPQRSGKLRAARRKPLAGAAAICRTEEARAAKKKEKAIYYPLGFTERLTLAGYFPEAKDFDPYIEGRVTWDNAGL